jgi:DNA-binding transcriptional MerR regulator
MQDQTQLEKRNQSRAIQKRQTSELLPIPEKLYFTIGEVAGLCSVKPHVLRYWETEFHHLKPKKRRGNRRYYKRDDVLLIRRIKNLLYTQGFTIEGAKTKLMSDIRSKIGSDCVNNTYVGCVESFKDVLTKLEFLLAEVDGQLSSE